MHVGIFTSFKLLEIDMYDVNIDIVCKIDILCVFLNKLKHNLFFTGSY